METPPKKKNSNSFKSGLLWRQTASQPAAVEVVVSGPPCPSPFLPHGVASQAEPFPSCSALQRALSSLCDGEGSAAGRETAVTVTSTAARAPFWKGYVVTDIPISTRPECIIILSVQSVWRVLLNCQTNKVSAATWTAEGGSLACFFVLVSVAEVGSYLK